MAIRVLILDKNRLTLATIVSFLSRNNNLIISSIYDEFLDIERIQNSISQFQPDVLITGDFYFEYEVRVNNIYRFSIKKGFKYIYTGSNTCFWQDKSPIWEPIPLDIKGNVTPGNDIYTSLTNLMKCTSTYSH